MYFHGDVCWPVSHREDVHRQLNVAGDVLALHVLETPVTHTFSSEPLLTPASATRLARFLDLTCLNCTMMSLESSMSLNMPSSLLVNAAPHSERGRITSVCSGSFVSPSVFARVEGLMD